MTAEWLCNADLGKPGRTMGTLSGSYLEAHLRLASLPTTRHQREHVDAMEEVRRKGREAAMRTMRERGKGHRGPSIELEGSRPAKPSSDKASAQNQRGSAA